MSKTTERSSLIPVADIIKARQRLVGVAEVTPLHRNVNLSKRYQANVILKREDLQVVRSFKIRGAYNKMAQLTKSETSNGIVCVSAGNHAQGVALACSKLNVRGTIFMPITTPSQKIQRVKDFGEGYVKVILTGDTFDDSKEAALKFTAENNLPFIHPFNDPDIIAGQGTVAVEILDHAKDPIDYLFVSVGGGGLISGMGSYFRQISPQTKIVAVEGAGAPSLKKSIDKGEIVDLESIDSFADGIAVKSIGDVTFKICKEVVDHHILVPEGKMCTTMLELYNNDAIVVEPSAACTVSALDFMKDEIKGKNVVCVLTGGNNDIARTDEIMERSMLYEGKKHYFIVKFPQRAGALQEFLKLLGPEDDISRFDYTKKTNRENGPALIGIELKDPGDFDSLINRFKEADIDFRHLNKRPLLFEMLV